jgi:hypothetical protein
MKVRTTVISPLGTFSSDWVPNVSQRELDAAVYEHQSSAGSMTSMVIHQENREVLFLHDIIQNSIILLEHEYDDNENPNPNLES